MFVELGAGDLGASINVAKAGGVRVIAVDPVKPTTASLGELASVGGSFVRGTASSLRAGIADHVFQHFPWRITGTGSHVSGGTWRLMGDAVRLLKPGGAAHFVTEELATAKFLAQEGSRLGLRVVLTETTAGAAAPASAGAGVPGMSRSLKVWMVNVYSPATGAVGGPPPGPASAPSAALEGPTSAAAVSRGLGVRWVSGRSVTRLAGWLAVTLLIDWYFAKHKRERIERMFAAKVDPEIKRRLEDQARLVEVLVDQDPYRPVYANILIELWNRETKAGVANATVDTTLEDVRVFDVGISFKNMKQRSTLSTDESKSYLTAQDFILRRELVTYSVKLEPPDLARRKILHDARQEARAGRGLPKKVTLSHWRSDDERDAYLAAYLEVTRNDPALRAQHEAALAKQAELEWLKSKRPKAWWDIDARGGVDLLEEIRRRKPPAE